MGIPTLLLRTDASAEIGMGHVMRCLALAQAWQDAGGRAVFVTAEKTASAEKWLHGESCEVISLSVQPGSAEDGCETIRIAREQSADWLVVDGYRFGCEYVRTVKADGFKVLFLDDYGHAQHYFADIVLNQNVSADETLYQNRDPQTRLLLGTRYCLLRREFLAWHDWKRKIPETGRRVLVTLGGSDQEDLNERVMQALSLVKREDLQATIVIGGHSPHRNGEALRLAPGKKITVRKNVLNLAELMAESDVAMSAAGSTCWELCLLP
jgi:UDP-2,4-diacetamido-2,4,6-trideoxy-beta-L-altropyranose hydrolase